MKTNNRIVFFDSSKSLFILFVIIAHSPINIDSFNNNQILFNIWQILGTFGVGGFYITSGYFNHNSRRINLTRLSKLFIPWLISSFLIYIALNIFNNLNFNIIDFTLFFIGYKSFYYFLTVLILLEVITAIVPKNIGVLLPIISIISILLTQFKIIQFLDLIYLNPFNWMLFYWFGQLMHNKKYSFEYYRKSILLITLFIFVFCVLIGSTTYFSIQNMLLEICISILIFSFFTNNECLITEKIGLYSFTFYLYHIPLVSLLNRLMSSLPWYLQLLKPVLTIVILMSIIEVFNKITNELSLKKLQSRLKFIIGLN